MTHGEDKITTPKTEKSNRTITMPDFLTEEVEEYIDSLDRIGRKDRIFAFTKDYLHHEMNRGAKQAGVKRIRIHDIRHSAILTKTAYPYTTGTVGTAVENHTYTYGNAGWKDQLTSLDGVAIHYDSIGNPTNDGTWTYTWQHGKQLAQMSRIGGNETISFEYNKDGLRTKKTVTNGEGTVITEYVLHGKNIVHMTRGTDKMHFFYGADDKPAIVVFNGTSYRYMYTLQGDVYGLIDENNSWVVFYRYDAWGKPLGIGGSLASTLGVLQPFRYRGYMWDEETGDYYLRSRYYRWGWGRFVSADVLIDGNMYCYCQNSTLTYIDEDGLIHQAIPHSWVCDDIVAKYTDLHRIHVKIDFSVTRYGLADIRSDNGQIWEVKRITCSPIGAIAQLNRYLTGRWNKHVIELKGGDGSVTRGRFRGIHGIIDRDGYWVVYFEVGNGFILYDYREKNQIQGSIWSEVREQAQERIPNFGSRPMNLEPSAYSNNTVNTSLAAFAFISGAFFSLSLSPSKCIYSSNREGTS